MNKEQAARLTRPIQPMPDDVRKQLESRGLMDAYRARPAYQQNDYLAWFTRSRQPETRTKRINQMLEELVGGEKYMNMAWRPRSRKS